MVNTSLNSLPRTAVDPSDQVQDSLPASLSLRVQRRTPSGGIHPHDTLAGHPQPLWFAHLSQDSPPTSTMSRFWKPAGYGVLTLPRKHPFNKPV
ncbi:hypothetical protein XENORESO_012146 [Xenotaenia resolanae]|uniref:Uncharacterized protein n=1 Tax=Xenotaenia resolanae TaxID=208358 RepID=A0ABV0WWH4_9TELE